MRVVIHDRRFNHSLRARYTLDCMVDYKSLPDNLPLTDKVIKQYAQTKSLIGFSSFRGLGIEDIKTILSATKRQEAHVDVDRMGNCAFYKLHKVSVK